MSKTTNNDSANYPKWSDLLKDAVNKPGTISKAFSQFHRYSIGNQLLAMWQCAWREITPGPIGTYTTWQKLGRQVKKGQRAIVLCMPITFKKAIKVKDEDGNEHDDEAVISTFVYRPYWFVMSQTDGDDLTFAPIPGWDRDRALAALGIEIVDFDMTNGNILGYAKEHAVAISPLAPHPENVLFHEIGHIELGHTSANLDQAQSRNEIEMEAESVNLILSESLGIGDPAESRGYIQNWFGKGNPISEKNARRIFSAVDKILAAGREKELEHENA